MTGNPRQPNGESYLPRGDVLPAGLVRGTPWQVPEDVDVTDGHVEWSDGRGRFPQFESADFFTDFLDLAGSSDSKLEQKVARYVRRWGPLGLCEAHGLPSVHVFGTRLPSGPGATAYDSCRPSMRGDLYQEPISRWRDLADNAVATLYAREKISASEHLTESIQRRAATLLPWGMVPAFDSPPVMTHGELSKITEAELEGQTGIIGGIAVRGGLEPEAVVGASVRQWLAVGNVGPTFRWIGDQYVFGVEYEGLAGAIAIRLASAVKDARPLVQCAYCQQWYTQTRRGTYFCRGAECNKKRLAANKRRQRAGQSRKNKPSHDSR